MENEISLIKKILAKIGLQSDKLNYNLISDGVGGHVYRLKISSVEYILKVSSAPSSSNILLAEQQGLETLKTSNSFRIPKVFASGKSEKSNYLLMEFIPQGKPLVNFWEIFAEKLAQLHQNSHSYFGFSEQNYIGSLPQFNKKENTAAEFYIHQRLEPQFKLASKNGFTFKNLQKVFKNISAEIPDEKPALIHGDLWNGNYLIDEKGFPALIDPAVCFGPREMDLAMMRLFGGFPEKIFSMYEEMFPLPEGAKKRIKLWQLYYLLVHLNIFGVGYRQAVEEVIAEFWF